MNRRSILAAYKKKSSHFQTGVTGFKSGNLFTLLRAIPTHRPCRREKRPCLGAFASYRRGSRPAIYCPKIPAFRGFFILPQWHLPKQDFPVQVNPTQINTK